MPRGLELAIGTLALLTTVISGTVVIEGRYAKANVVEQNLQGLWAKTLKLRILELELKPADQFTTADRALLEHMKQELREATGSEQ